MKKRINIVLCTGLLLLIFSGQSAGQVTRKPYLQIPAPSGIVVRWQTGTGEVSNLYYGTSASSLTHVATESTDERIYHEVKVTGLKPSTKYYYSVDGPNEGTEDQYFITPPESGRASPVRIWVISDFGQTNSDMNARRLETVARWDTFNNTSYHANFVLSLGDQTEDDAIYQIQHNFFDQLEKVLINTPIYTVVGNHDSHDSLYNYLRTYTLPANGEARGVANPSPQFVHYPMFPVYFSAPGVEGSVVVDINDNKLNLWFLCDEINSEGSHVWDHFTIVKN